MEMETILAGLDEIEALLRRMQMLAERSAEDGCGGAERVRLQKRLTELRRQLDAVADRLPPL